jgi:hypothetical protein
MPPSLNGKLLDFSRNRTVVWKAIGQRRLGQIQLAVKVVRHAGENLPLPFLLDLFRQLCECSIHQRRIVCFGNARPRSREQVTINRGGDTHTTHATGCSIARQLLWEPGGWARSEQCENDRVVHRQHLRMGERCRLIPKFTLEHGAEGGCIH